MDICKKCGGNLALIDMDFEVNICYSYDETIKTYYLKCEECNELHIHTEKETKEYHESDWR